MTCIDTNYSCNGPFEIKNLAPARRESTLHPRPPRLGPSPSPDALLPLGLIAAVTIYEGGTYPLPYLAVLLGVETLLALRGARDVFVDPPSGPRWLGPVTPLGGLSLIAGWVLAACAALAA